jgi:hypothetical protein
MRRINKNRMLAGGEKPTDLSTCHWPYSLFVAMRIRPAQGHALLSDALEETVERVYVKTQ